MVLKAYCPGEDMFDLIILDLNMPVSDGYEACKSILQLFSDTNMLQRSMQINPDSVAKA